MALGAASTSHASPPAPAEAPKDPNDAPFLRPPLGQAAPTPIQSTPALAPPHDAGRRLALTVLPAYGSFRLPLRGRPDGARYPGAGAFVEADVQLLRFAWLRLQAGYTGHPVDEVRFVDGDELKVAANRGTLHATSAGVGVALGIDVGRVLPLVDLGVGAFRIGTPTGALPGQRDQPCFEGGCDTGLACVAGTCQVTLVPEVHAGVGVDIQLRRHWAIGAALKYFALLVQPQTYPVYLVGALRLTARF